MSAPMLDPLKSFARWRESCADGMLQWLNWMLDEDLCAARDEVQLRQVIAKFREERFTVAIVSELARGKSELINALLFTEHGRRIVPSGAGRTTMCPTEFFCDPKSPPYLELLPIETRGNHETLNELRGKSYLWERFTIAPNDAERLAQDLLKVGETQQVLLADAVALGLADDHDRQDSALVEIPRWRHARINLHHPLLATGLCVLDTPGLNALGNEPELTYAVLPSADAVLFLLAADVGVTRSDKMAWSQHLSHIPTQAKWVVLNKIDSMWDELKSAFEIRIEIARQVEQCAKTLDVPATQVFPISAQKALYARVNQDASLLSKSRIESLELSLTRSLLISRQSFLSERARGAVVGLFQESKMHIESKLQAARQQFEEMADLIDTSTDSAAMMQHFEADKTLFEAEGHKILGLRKLIQSHTATIFGLIHPRQIEAHFREMIEACSRGNPGAVERAWKEALNQAQTGFIQARAESDAAVMVLRNAHLGSIKINRPKRLPLDDAIAEIERLRLNSKLELPIIPVLTGLHRKRLLRTCNAVMDRLKTLATDCTKDAEIWLYGLVTPIERTLRDKQQSLRRRADTLSRMQDAQSTLGEMSVSLQALISQEALRYEELLQRARAVQAVLNTADVHLPVQPSPVPPPT